jgi:S1-C subfamily serine protease
MIRRTTLLVCAVVLAAPFNSSSQEFNSLVTLSTVKVSGPSALDKAKASFGTGFLVGRPSAPGAKDGAQVLVTAAHVPEGIGGDTLNIVARRANADGSHTRVVVNQMFRRNGKPLYVKHPSADVAVFYSIVPQVTTVASSALLADDALLRKYEVTIGDEVLAAGYPFGVEAQAGAPVLRRGTISSSITPSAQVNVFLIDYNVHFGNSGGPVYLYQRGRYLSGPNGLWNVSIILGLVSKQHFFKTDVSQERLEIAEIVPARFIREAIDLLPAPVY